MGWSGQGGTDMTTLRHYRPSVAVAIVAVVLTTSVPITVRAQGALPQHEPLLISLFTESETGGLGCLSLSVISGAALWRAMGGRAGIALAVNGGVTAPARVLEAAAAAAFVFSSTCYIGQALAPLTATVAASISEALFGGGGASRSRASAPATLAP